jgi:hypothetical protein
MLYILAYFLGHEALFHELIWSACLAGANSPLLCRINFYSLTSHGGHKPSQSAAERTKRFFKFWFEFKCPHLGVGHFFKVTHRIRFNIALCSGVDFKTPWGQFSTPPPKKIHVCFLWFQVLLQWLYANFIEEEWLKS